MLAAIKIPPEAVIPLAIATVALLVLIFFGNKLADWKRRAPEAASTFGLAVAGVLTSCAVFYARPRHRHSSTKGRSCGFVDSRNGA